MTAEAPRGLGDVHHQVGAALQLVRDTEGPATNRTSPVSRPRSPRSARHSSSIAWRSASMASSSSMTRCGVGEVAGEEGVGAGARSRRRERRKADDAERHVSRSLARSRSGIAFTEPIIDWSRRRCRWSPFPTVCPLFTFAPQRGHCLATSRPYDPRRYESSTFQEGTSTCDVRSFVVCGIVLAALALPVLVAGTARPPRRRSQTKLASATLNGDGSTFPLGFYQVAIGDVQAAAEGRDDQLPGRGLGAGPHRLREQGRSTSPAPTPRTSDRHRSRPTPFLYFPTVVGADHGVVQPRRA